MMETLVRPKPRKETPATLPFEEPREALMEQEGGPRRWTRDEYHRMVEAGVLDEAERVELIRGEVVRKVSPMSRPHAWAIRATGVALAEAFGDAFDVWQQIPLQTERSEPEPDITVLPVSCQTVLEDHPPCSAAVLLVEISLSSIRKDRAGKAALYAENGVAEYWVLNLHNRTLEAYREPALPGSPLAPGYRSITLYTEQDAVAPLAAPQAAVSLARLLPPAA